jgi:hypothetical protein
MQAVRTLTLVYAANHDLMICNIHAIISCSENNSLQRMNIIYWPTKWFQVVPNV